MQAIGKVNVPSEPRHLQTRFAAWGDLRFGCTRKFIYWFAKIVQKKTFKTSNTVFLVRSLRVCNVFLKGMISICKCPTKPIVASNQSCFLQLSWILGSHIGGVMASKPRGRTGGNFHRDLGDFPPSFKDIKDITICWISLSPWKIQLKGKIYRESSSRWWQLKYFFIFTPTCGRFPFWLIFFRWIETTNQSCIQLL